MIVTKSSWGYGDAIDNLPAEIYRNLSEIEQRILDGRTVEHLAQTQAIDFSGVQRPYKQELMAAIIEANLGSSEFFVNKANGWARAEYSKKNRDWVAEFVSSIPIQIERYGRPANTSDTDEAQTAPSVFFRQSRRNGGKV
jgi:3-methyladenine DNA glycosylase AlkD